MGRFDFTPKWKYQGGSPLQLRKAVLEDRQLGSAALGFCLSATVYGTKKSLAGKMDGTKADRFGLSVHNVLKTSAKLFALLKESPVTGRLTTVNTLAGAFPELGLLFKSLDSSLPVPSLLQLPVVEPIRLALQRKIGAALDPLKNNEATEASRLAIRAQASEENQMGLRHSPLLGGMVTRCFRVYPKAPK